MRMLPRHDARDGSVLGGQSDTADVPPGTMLVGPSGAPSVRACAPSLETAGVSTDEPPAHPAKIVDASNAATALGTLFIDSLYSIMRFVK